jgi:hypothetical protein
MSLLADSSTPVSASQTAYSSTMDISLMVYFSSVSVWSTPDLAALAVDAIGDR